MDQTPWSGWVPGDVVGLWRFRGSRQVGGGGKGGERVLAGEEHLRGQLA
jgi:hypothetical protein